jgi:hypothetical protein
LHCNNHRLQWRSLEGAEMKIYLLILLIGALLTTIHFTQSSETEAGISKQTAGFRAAAACQLQRRRPPSTAAASAPPPHPGPEGQSGMQRQRRSSAFDRCDDHTDCSARGG